MSDARLSTLRRAALTGDLSARVAWLSEWLRVSPACETCAVPADAVRDEAGRFWRSPARILNDQDIANCPACHGTGTQRRSRVELAAYCGDEAAQAVLGSSWRSEAAGGSQAAAAGLAVYRDGPGSRAAFEGWARGLSRWGRETATRAAVAASRAALDHAQRRDHRDWDWADVLDRARVCVEAGEAWLSCPCDEHLEAWRRAWAVFPPPPQWAPAPDVEGWTLSTAGRQAPCALVDVTAPAAAQASSESSVRSAIQRSLTEWALSPPGP
jgi:hypothetical protein